MKNGTKEPSPMMRGKDLEETLSAVSRLIQRHVYPQPTGLRERFQALHESVRASEEDLRRRLQDRWLGRFREHVFRDVQETLTACHYHLDNIQAQEEQLAADAPVFLADVDMSHFPYGFSAGLRPNRVTFEYHAFLFAADRTLQYFSKSVGEFFKVEVKGLRDLQKNKQFKKAKPAEVRARAQKALTAGLEQVRGVSPASTGGKTLRDLLAHWKHIGSGTFDILCRQDGSTSFVMVGGGERLNPDFRPGARGEEFQTLTGVLGRQLSAVEALIFDTYAALALPDALHSAGGADIDLDVGDQRS